MPVPSFCYQKAFWVLLGIMVTVITTTSGIVYAMVLENTERSIENQKELAYREQVVKLIPKIYENQIIMCTSLHLDCVK